MKPLDPILTVAWPPHAHCGRTVIGRMTEIMVALMPAAFLAVAAFGMEALRVMSLCCAVAVITEYGCSKAMRIEPRTWDFHSLLIGLMFAFLLPASAPWWLAVVGSAASVALGKMIFGGLGGNPLCPPLVGWAICRLSWPDVMDTNATMLSSALPAPLHQLKAFGLESVQSIPLTDLLLGRQLGGLGEVQLLGLLAGAAFLFLRRHLRWQIPVGFIAGLLATATVYRMIDPAAYAPPLFHLLAGGSLFGAFFLAPDTSSSPIGRIPAVLYGLIAGTLVIIIRVYGIYPDGVPFAILLANLFTPLLDRIRPQAFGMRREDIAARGGGHE
ncbi:RnfABCDGE type electron transport complex subunit D [Pseudodesulfovibrio tunisiensis]|uniref:RnfABCDGE type electron transport complex subunit D n=1 Tax=Pseudodesulfovibrio tunisiensis TaxID=463192 RepID=UPI001FB2B922|nr:RnfABCDGE type electron transport complex subunit D [Pseudodesulfovibrio tunisiensis]